MQRLEDEVSRQREQIDTLKRDKQDLLGRLGDALKKVDQARTTEAQMKAQINQTQTALDNALADKGSDEERKALEERVAMLTDALQQVRDERDVADEFARDLQQRIGKVQAESEKRIGAVTAERDQALAALAKSEKAQEQVDKLMSENATLLAKLEEAETSIRKFNAEMPKKEEEIAQLRLEVASAKEMLAKAQAESKEYQSSMADLRAQLESANTNLADAKASGTAKPGEIAELTKENDLLRGIVLRQLKEQARRDQAKKLVLAELGKLEGKSDVLMNQLEYLGQPLVKLTEEERALFKDPQIELPEIEDPSAMEISIMAPKATESQPPHETALDGSSSLANFGLPESPLGDPTLPTSPGDSGAAESATSPQVETALHPNVPEGLMPLAHEAREYFDRGQYREAEKTYEKMLAEAPTNVYILSNLGVVRFRSGKLRLAEEAFQKAIEVDPKDSFSRCTLGIVYYQQGKYDEAIDELTKALAVDSKNATAHNYLGITASQKGWHEAAQKEMETAIALDPNYADAYFNLAVIHATAQPPNREAARKYYEKALSLGAKPDPALASLLN
jgi:tetratricopeptide (TPR) repeat protein